MPRYVLANSTAEDIKVKAKDILMKISEEQEEDIINYSWYNVIDEIPNKDFKISGSDCCFNGPEGDYEITYDEDLEDEPFNKSKVGSEFKALKYYKGNGFEYGLASSGVESWEKGPRYPKFYVCIYLDDHNNLRAFCPTVGNCYNYYTKFTFNWRTVRGAKTFDERQPENWSFAKHPEFGLSRYCNDETSSAAYTKEFDRYIDWLISTQDLDKIHAEIRSRICIMGRERQCDVKPKDSRKYEDFIKLYPKEYDDFVKKSNEEFNKKYPNGFVPKKPRTSVYRDIDDLTIVIRK